MAAAPPGKCPTDRCPRAESPPTSPAWKTRSRFVQELQKLGWLEGQNIILEYRWADMQPSRLSTLAAELGRLPVDLIVVDDTPAIRAITHATTSIPIVMISVSDPLQWGAVTSLAWPGGNVTGVGGMVLELSGKLLELLKAAVPAVTRMAIFAGENLRTIQDIQRAAQVLGVHPQFLTWGILTNSSPPSRRPCETARARSLSCPPCSMRSTNDTSPHSRASTGSPRFSGSRNLRRWGA